LTFEGDQLVACAGHHVEPILVDSGEFVEFVRLFLLAISLENRGRKLEDGSALSDAVIRLAVSDATDTHGEKPLTAIVANNNHRSMAVLERNGRWSQVRYGTNYIRFVGLVRFETVRCKL